MSNLPFWTCPECGSNLDHGESCDCGKDKPVVSYSDEVREKLERGKRTELSTYDDAMLVSPLLMDDSRIVRYSFFEMDGYYRIQLTNGVFFTFSREDFAEYCRLYGASSTIQDLVDHILAEAKEKRNGKEVDKNA